LNTVDLSKFEFEPDITFDSGQTFRWKRTIINSEPAWVGVVREELIKVDRQKAERLASIKNNQTENFSDEIADYFSIGDNLREINGSLPKDKYLQEALNQYRGLRILSQDPWECLISFVCSINKNIPAIKMMIELLSTKFGTKIPSSFLPVYTFPKPSTLAKASKMDLLACKLGFRWRFVKFIANQVHSGKLDLQRVSKMPYEKARSELISELSGATLGVGPKVADCVLLFSMHKTESFPIDVWILRCIQEKYAQKLHLNSIVQDKKWITARTYDTIRKKASEYFGKYCGYAQQYLYMKVRQDSIRNKVQA
jgi:N-glycosylase/DNA lyase